MTGSIPVRYAPCMVTKLMPILEALRITPRYRLRSVAPFQLAPKTDARFLPRARNPGALRGRAGHSSLPGCTQASSTMWIPLRETRLHRIQVLAVALTGGYRYRCVHRAGPQQSTIVAR